MQYNVCIWALSDYNEQKGKNMPLEIYFLFFCVSSQIVTWYNLLRIKNIFCILCALRVFPHLQLSSYTVRNLHSDYLM